MARGVVFSPISWAEFHFWLRADAKIYGKLSGLIDECRRDPFSGSGKPEQLKHQAVETWARRIDEKNRLTYSFNDSEILVRRCRYHYGDK
jgi:toxin YoeB